MTPAELRSWRKSAGLSQDGLAALLDVHKLTVSRWERGVREIPPFLYMALNYIAEHRVQTGTGRQPRSPPPPRSTRWPRCSTTVRYGARA